MAILGPNDGADEAGDYLTAGRTNQTEARTRLVGTNGDTAGYQEGYVLDVASENDRLVVLSGDGVDAIHAKGTVEFATGGLVGTIPAGNGVVGRGLNGLVGYVHSAARDTGRERSVHSGVYGIGDGASSGLFGQGLNGVVGYERTTPRDTNYELQERAGVFGRGEIGVSGDGANGPGVHGRGTPGVRGEAPGIGPGVLAEGETGVIAEGRDGPGVHARSLSDRAGIFETRGAIAQVWLIPLSSKIKDPGQLPKSEAGELLVLKERNERGLEIASLWFCTVGGPAGQAGWAKLA